MTKIVIYIIHYLFVIIYHIHYADRNGSGNENGRLHTLFNGFFVLFIDFFLLRLAKNIYKGWRTNNITITLKN